MDPSLLTTLHAQRIIIKLNIRQKYKIILENDTGLRVRDKHGRYACRPICVYVCTYNVCTYVCVYL